MGRYCTWKMGLEGRVLWYLARWGFDGRYGGEGVQRLLKHDWGHANVDCNHTILREP